MSIFSNKSNNVFNDMGVRERSLVFITTVVLIFYIWDAFLMAGLEKTLKNLQPKKPSIENQLVLLDTQIASLKVKARKMGQQGPVSGNDVDSLNKEIRRLDEIIVNFTSGAVKPNEIIGVLKKVLTDVDGLKVSKMNVLNATPLDENALSDVKKYFSTKVLKLYKHEIEIELHGNYFGVYEYLRRLESYRQVFYWNEITYKALAWPTALINLKVYTLTSSEGGAGV